MLKNLKAFTLIELMVTISILGVVIGLALPSFNKQILNNKSTVLGEDLITQFNLARYEAIKRGKRVSICASANSTTATPTCSSDWVKGYMIFVDKAKSDDASTPDLGSPTEIIKTFAKEDDKASIEVKNGTTAVGFVRFTALGTLALVDNVKNPIVVKAKMTGCKGLKMREITIGLSGLIAAQDKDCQ